MDPLGLSAKNPSIGHRHVHLLRVGLELQPVHGLEGPLVVARPVPDHDLGGVFIRHYDGGLGESGSIAVGVVGFEGLLNHPNVVVVPLLVS